jgi:restriction endonuclease S subunit
MLDEVKLPLPDISIQNKISKQLSEIDNNVRQVNKLQTQKIDELLKLKQAILKLELKPKEVA